MYNSFPKLTSKYTMGVNLVLSLLNSDIFDISLTLYTSVSMWATPGTWYLQVGVILPKMELGAGKHSYSTPRYYYLDI